MTLSTQPLRIALVGLGWAATSIWLPRLTASTSYLVVDGVDANAMARKTFERSLPTARIHESIEDLDPKQVDLAVVTVPNHLHASVASSLLASGISVFLEKPVCLDSTEAAQLARAELASTATLLAGSAAQYRTDVRALYETASSLGDIRHIDISWVRARGIPGGSDWFTQRSLSGGGALFDLGWHLIDVLSPILGGHELVHAVGTTSDDFVGDSSWGAVWKFGTPAVAHPRIDVEDNVRAFMVTDDGTSIALRAAWASHHEHDTTKVRVEGSAGTALLECTFGFSPDRIGGSSLIRTEAGQSVTIDFPDEEIGTEYNTQLADIPRLLADPASRGSAIANAGRTIDAIERIYKSANTIRRATASTA